jgi:hypothetical protein
MCSIIDQQKELVPTRVVVTREFIEHRIQEQFNYCVDVGTDFNRTVERRRELVNSAMGHAINLFNSLEPHMCTTVLFAWGAASVVRQVVVGSKPIPSWIEGGIYHKGPAVIGEHGREIILNQKQL